MDALKKLTLTLLISSLTLSSNAQESDSSIPETVLQEWSNLTKDGGKWTTTDNSGQYDAWEITFSWGLGKKTVNASLNAIKDGENLGSSWKFKLFYHPETKKIILEQWASDGSYGIGTLVLKENGKSENVSTFYFPNNARFKIKHEQIIDGDTKYTDVFVQDENGEWKKDRVYTWKRGA